MYMRNTAFRWPKTQSATTKPTADHLIFIISHAVCLQEILIKASHMHTLVVLCCLFWHFLLSLHKIRSRWTQLFHNVYSVNSTLKASVHHDMSWHVKTVVITDPLSRKFIRLQMRGFDNLFVVDSRGLFFYHGSNLILAWINNHMPKCRMKLLIHFETQTAQPLKFRAWYVIFFPHIEMDVISYPCCY